MIKSIILLLGLFTVSFSQEITDLELTSTPITTTSSSTRATTKSNTTLTSSSFNSTSSINETTRNTTFTSLNTTSFFNLTNSTVFNITNTTIFNITNTTITKSLGKEKAHATLMLLAWIFLASSGILIARYYDFIFKNSFLCNASSLHKLLMIWVPILSTISFFVILIDLKGYWVNSSKGLALAHSIIGIIVIVLSIIQPFIGFSHTLIKEKRVAKFFRYLHRIVGFMCIVLATIAIFFGFFITHIPVKATGWGIMIAWACWIIFLPLLLEVLEIIFKIKDEHDLLIENKKGSMEAKEMSFIVKNKEIKLKTIQRILLVLHFMIASSITAVLIFHVTTS